MKNNKNLFYLLVFFIVYFLIDYFNILTRLSINIKNINIEILNVSIIIIFYLFTFHFIDKKQLEKESNKVEVSKIILKNIYKTCLSNIELLTDEIINNFVVPKCDFNKLLYEDKYMHNLLNQPFQNEILILDLLKDGVISRDLYENYSQCKESYQRYISIRILFYDKPDMWNYKKETSSLLLKKSIESLND